MIGENIEKLRQSLGLSREELATEAGVTYSTLTKIEAGYDENPTVKTIKRLSIVLGVSVDDLLEE